MYPSLAHTGSIGAFRRLVASFTIIAWVFGTLVCPEAAEAFGTTPQSAVHKFRGESGAGNLRHSSSCNVFTHASTLLASTIGATADRADGMQFLLAVLPLVSGLAATGSMATGIARFYHGPPRTRSARFATSWSHAPPAL